jgi:nucleotide-binding universal stress UspA family protein
MKEDVVKVNTICVGVDGSPAGQTALAWATGEAARRGAELVVLHAYDWRVTGALTQVGAEYAELARAAADALVAAAVEWAGAAAPGIPVRGEAVLGPPNRTLVAASSKYDLTVLGNRGRGGFASLLLGSVSQHLAMHAAGPVVVVRGRAEADDHGPVVVGVDAAPISERTVRAGFEAAAARGTELVAVRAFAQRYVPEVDLAVGVEESGQRRREEQRRLVDDLEPWRLTYPAVPVRCVAVEGEPAEVLIGLSGSAQLVVVGARGHGGFAGLVLGSTGLHLLHHAACPVLVARDPEA